MQDVIFLGENRPIFLRLRVDARRPAVPRRPGSTRSRRSTPTSTATATAPSRRRRPTGRPSPTLVRVATGGAAALPRADLDVQPEGRRGLARRAGRRPPAGPRARSGSRSASSPTGRTDALFDHLDRDKDGKLTRPELAAVAGSLRRLDLDDDELIDATSSSRSATRSAMQTEDMPGRRGRYAAVPPVIELTPDESSLRPVRLLLKKYDKGTGDGASAGDNKLSPGEFAIDPEAFAGGRRRRRRRARHRGAAPVPRPGHARPRARPSRSRPTPRARPRSRVAGGGARPSPPGVKVQQLADGDVEVAVGEVRLEIHVDDGAAAVDDARRVLRRASSRPPTPTTTATSRSPS